MDKETIELIIAAESCAAAYQDDPRKGITSDVMNAFFAGAAYQQGQAKQADIYTCKGKGGQYELVGPSKGAGTMRGTLHDDLVIYRATESGALYHRTAADFAERMEIVYAKP